MAGKFINEKYESDSGAILNIRVQPETVFDVNLSPAGAVTVSRYARVTGSRRAYGMKARSVTLSRQIGDGTNYNAATAYARIPVLKKASVAALIIGSTVTYQNVAWTIVSHNAESNR